MASLFAASAQMSIAVFPFHDTGSVQSGPETVRGLGAQIQGKLERYFVEHLPEIPVTKEEIVIEILDQKGLDMLGIIDADYLAKLGQIDLFTHIWTGTYTSRGRTLDLEAQLWSLEEAKVVEVAHASTSRFVPEWYNAVEQAACALFQDVYYRHTDRTLGLACPRVFPGVSFDLSAQIGLASVRMGAVNNVIREAVELRGVKMDPLSWIPEVSLRAAFAFMPRLELIASCRYMWDSRDAGASASVTLDVSAFSVAGGLAYAWEPAPEGPILIELDGQVGWTSGDLRKVDVDGALACPARVIADGFSFDGSARLCVRLFDGWTAELAVGLRGMRLPAPSAQVRDLDFGGISVSVCLRSRLWGDEEEQ